MNGVALGTPRAEGIGTPRMKGIGTPRMEVAPRMEGTHPKGWRGSGAPRTEGPHPKGRKGLVPQGWRVPQERRGLIPKDGGALVPQDGGGAPHSPPRAAHLEGGHRDAPSTLGCTEGTHTEGSTSGWEGRGVAVVAGLPSVGGANGAGHERVGHAWGWERGDSGKGRRRGKGAGGGSSPRT